MLQNVNKDPNYHKVKEIIDQKLSDKRLLLTTALIAVLQALKANLYRLNSLNCSYSDVEDYITNDVSRKNLLQFAESCYDTLLKSYVKAIA